MLTAFLYLDITTTNDIDFLYVKKRNASSSGFLIYFYSHFFICKKQNK